MLYPFIPALSVSAGLMKVQPSFSYQTSVTGAHAVSCHILNMPFLVHTH